MDRVQRKRSKGSKLPPKTLYCGRPSRLGNPLVLKEDIFDNKTLFFNGLELGRIQKVLGNEYLVELHAAWLNEQTMFLGIDVSKTPYWIAPPTRSEIETMVQGYEHLACWCSLDKRCHVDNVLAVLGYGAMMGTTK